MSDEFKELLEKHLHKHLANGRSSINFIDKALEAGIEIPNKKFEEFFHKVDDQCSPAELLKLLGENPSFLKKLYLIHKHDLAYTALGFAIAMLVNLEFSGFIGCYLKEDSVKTTNDFCWFYKNYSPSHIIGNTIDSIVQYFTEEAL